MKILKIAAIAGIIGPLSLFLFLSVLLRCTFGCSSNDLSSTNESVFAAILIFIFIVSLVLLFLGFVKLGEISQNKMIKLFSYISLLFSVVAITLIYMDSWANLNVGAYSLFFAIAPYISITILGIFLFRSEKELGVFSGYTGLTIAVSFFFVASRIFYFLWFLVIPAYIMVIVLFFKMSKKYENDFAQKL